MPHRTRPWKWVLVAAAILGPAFSPLVATVDAGAAMSPFSGQSASHVLTEALAASNQEGSAHDVAVFDSGGVSTVFVQDSAAQSGEQSVTIGTNEKASVILLDNVAYITGNQQAVTGFFGFPKSLGPTLAGKWISFQPADQGYSTVSAGVTLPSALKEITPTGPMSMGRTTRMGGKSVVGISGKVPGGHETVYVATTGPPLIVGVKASGHSGGHSGTDRITFSRWGEPVNLSAPAGAIPLSALANAQST